MTELKNAMHFAVFAVRHVLPLAALPFSIQLMDLMKHNHIYRPNQSIQSHFCGCQSLNQLWTKHFQTESIRSSNKLMEFAILFVSSFYSKRILSERVPIQRSTNVKSDMPNAFLFFAHARKSLKFHRWFFNKPCSYLTHTLFHSTDTRVEVWFVSMSTNIVSFIIEHDATFNFLLRKQTHSLVLFHRMLYLFRQFYFDFDLLVSCFLFSIFGTLSARSETHQIHLNTIISRRRSFDANVYVCVCVSVGLESIARHIHRL